MQSDDFPDSYDEKNIRFQNNTPLYLVCQLCTSQKFVKTAQDEA